MTKKLTLILSVAASAFIAAHIFVGCGGSSGGGGSSTKPTADAGQTQDVNAGSSITLDGSGSSDPNGDTLTYAWTQASGGTVTLSDATMAEPTFTAGSIPGTCVFQLIVNDGTEASDPATVTIKVWIDITKRLFVNASASLATADGSQGNPYTTISSAITAATNGEDVYVAGGTYSEGITMAEGVSLFGGYEAVNWTRDITANTTTISPSEASVITAGSGVTTATYISGFTIVGPDGSGFTISIDGGAPAISYNTISGAASAGGSQAINCKGNGDGAIISDNTITLGSTTDTSGSSKVEGIGIEGCTNVTVSGNTISGSSGAVNLGIDVAGNSTATIRQNTISPSVNVREQASATIARNRIVNIVKGSAGDAVIENNIITNSIGISLGGSGRSDIVNNTIHLGGDPDGNGNKIGINNNNSAGTTNVINNLIIQDSTATPSTQTCILRNASAPVFNSVLNNDCDAQSGGVRYKSGATSYTTIGEMETALESEGTSNVDGNVAWDPSLQSGSDYLLSGSSNLIGGGYAGTLVALPTDDYDGDARPASTGYDIGADQFAGGR